MAGTPPVLPTIRTFGPENMPILTITVGWCALYARYGVQYGELRATCYIRRRSVGSFTAGKPSLTKSHL